jgi:hypothetical protein
MKIKGHVILKLVSKSSKSEHEAVCLQAGDKSYILRERGKNAFNNPALEALVGKQIEASGEIVGNIFFIRNYTVTDDV